MEIKEIITYEYKTKDGKVFTNKNEAKVAIDKIIIEATIGSKLVLIISIP